MGPVCTPTTDPSHPHWNTATITPYAAPIDSMFITAALTGTAIDRNATINKKNETRMTPPMTQISRWEKKLAVSMPPAVGPPTSARVPVPFTADGVGGLRSPQTSDLVASLGGDDGGMATITLVPPLGFSRAGPRAATTGVDPIAAAS